MASRIRRSETASSPATCSGFDGDQPLEHGGGIVLVGEVEPRLARHHGVAQQLQGQRGLAQALGAAQQGQLARAQAARQVGVERLESGGPHPGGRRRAHRQLPVGFGHHGTEVAQQVGHPLIVAETGPPRIRCLGDSWARTDDLRRGMCDRRRMSASSGTLARAAERFRHRGAARLAIAVRADHARPGRRPGRPVGPPDDPARLAAGAGCRSPSPPAFRIPSGSLPGSRWPRRWLPPLIMVVSRPFDPSLLPYLLAPAFAAGVSRRAPGRR